MCSHTPWRLKPSARRPPYFSRVLQNIWCTVQGGCWALPQSTRRRTRPSIRVVHSASSAGWGYHGWGHAAQDYPQRVPGPFLGRAPCLWSQQGLGPAEEPGAVGQGMGEQSLQEG